MAMHPQLASVPPHHIGVILYLYFFFARFQSDNSCMVSIKMNFH